MVPEILGFLIILGALLVLVVRFISQRQKGVDTEELRESTEQLKAELTRSADAVIARMGNHIQHLENLLHQADERNVRLEAGINEYKRIAQELEERSAALNQELSEARKSIAELKAFHALPGVQPIVSMMGMTNMAGNPMAPAPQRVDAQDFAAVLQNSMEREETEISSVNAQQAAGLAEAMNRRPEEAEENLVEAQEEEEQRSATAEQPLETERQTISPNAAKAKALLRSGYSVEETARETGMGRGAIELLKEMNKRDLE